MKYKDHLHNALSGECYKYETADGEVLKIKRSVRKKFNRLMKYFERAAG